MKQGPVLATGPLFVVNVSGHVIFTHAFGGTLRSWGDADASAVRAARYGVTLHRYPLGVRVPALACVCSPVDQTCANPFVRPPTPRLLQESNPTETQQRH